MTQETTNTATQAVTKLSAEMIANLAKGMRDRKEKSGGGKYPAATFLPEGEHTVRIFTDPVGNLYRELRSNGYFSYGIQSPADCGNLPENFDYAELDDVLEELSEYQVWKLGTKFNFMFYVHVISTNAASDNWKAGNTYVAIGNGKVASAFTDFIVALGEDSPDTLVSMLDKDVAASPVKITLVRGNQGSCTFTPLFSKAPAVPVDESYQPLSQAYIRDGYDRDKYINLLKMARKLLDETRATRKAKGLPLVSDANYAEYAAAQEAADQESKQEEKSESKEETKPESSANTDQMVEDKQESKPEDKQETATGTGDVEDRFARFRKKQ